MFSNHMGLGGYQGPVEVLTADGVVVAAAACRYHAGADQQGQDRWRGRLHRIAPPGAVGAGTYRLRLPQGEEGDIVVQEGPSVRDIVHFEGTGPRPRLGSTGYTGAGR